MNLQKAVRMLKKEGYTCVLWGEEVLTSRERGVRPLLSWLEEGAPREGYVAADKVIGKASAFLYVLLGITRVYGGVVSQAALSVFERYSIKCDFDASVPSIRNRSNTGMCPMEESVLSISDPSEALEALKKRLAELSEGKN